MTQEHETDEISPHRCSVFVGRHRLLDGLDRSASRRFRGMIDVKNSHFRGSIMPRREGWNVRQRAVSLCVNPDGNPGGIGMHQEQYHATKDLGKAAEFDLSRLVPRC